MSELHGAMTHSRCNTAIGSIRIRSVDGPAYASWRHSLFRRAPTRFSSNAGTRRLTSGRLNAALQYHESACYRGSVPVVNVKRIAGGYYGPSGFAGWTQYGVTPGKRDV